MKTKLIYLARRNPALTEDDFPVQWKKHSALAGTLPKLRAYFTGSTQCHNLRDPGLLPEADLYYDGVAIVGLANREASSVLWQEPDFLRVQIHDERRVFSDVVKNFSLDVDEDPIVDGPRCPYCLITFLARNTQIEVQAFRAAVQRHTARLNVLASHAAHVRRFVLNHVVLKPPPGYEYDGVMEQWFDTPHDVRSVVSDPDYRAIVATDRPTFSDTARTVIMLTQVTHAWPPLAGQSPTLP